MCHSMGGYFNKEVYKIDSRSRSYCFILIISCQYSITLQKTIDTCWNCWCIWRLNKGKYITLNILEGHCRSYFHFKVYLSCCPIYSSLALTFLMLLIFSIFFYVRGNAQNNLTLSIFVNISTHFMIIFSSFFLILFLSIS